MSQNFLNHSAEEPSFESAFSRLEAILEQMNTGTVSLDTSLHLYEEADKLISFCNKRLTEAEQRVEILVKQRTGELQMAPSGQPLMTDFSACHMPPTAEDDLDG